jgi:hypothetical protein
MRRRPRAFSMAELILSLGFFAIVVLVLIALSITVLRTDSKALETSAGSLVADRLMAQTIAGLKADDPAGIRDEFLSAEPSANPWRQGQVTNHHTIFYYTITVSTVKDGAGQPLGAEAGGNRLKKMDVHVRWAGQDRSGRTGFGQLEVWAAQLVNESELEVGDAP